MQPSISWVFGTLVATAFLLVSDRGGEAATPAEVTSLPTGSNYVYVYDMPDRFTNEILSMPLDQDLESWSQWYDIDQHVHRWAPA